MFILDRHLKKKYQSEEVNSYFKFMSTNGGGALLAKNDLFPRNNKKKLSNDFSNFSFFQLFYAQTTPWGILVHPKRAIFGLLFTIYGAQK